LLEPQRRKEHEEFSKMCRSSLQQEVASIRYRSIFVFFAFFAPLRFQIPDRG
jgi:hypothetical protein